MKLNRNLVIILAAAIAGIVFYVVTQQKERDTDEQDRPAVTKRKALLPAPSPYPTQQLNALYNLIFCDRTEIVESKLKRPYPYPYSVLFDPAKPVDELRHVITDSTLDTRVKIVAWNKIRESGMRNRNRALLGIVIEIGMEKGLDVLAVYDDYAARYINQSGKVLANETTDKESSVLIEKMLDSSQALTSTAKVTEPRTNYPGNGTVRLTLITTDGLCMTEGSPDIMFQGAQTGPVLRNGTKLLQALMKKAVPAEVK